MLANEASAVCGIDMHTGEHAVLFFLVVAAELFNIIWSNFVCMMMMLLYIYKAHISGGKNYMGSLTNVKDKAGVIL